MLYQTVFSFLRNGPMIRTYYICHVWYPYLVSCRNPHTFTTLFKQLLTTVFVHKKASVETLISTIWTLNFLTTNNHILLTFTFETLKVTQAKWATRYIPSKTWRTHTHKKSRQFIYNLTLLYQTMRRRGAALQNASTFPVSLSPLRRSQRTFPTSSLTHTLLRSLRLVQFVICNCSDFTDCENSNIYAAVSLHTINTFRRLNNKVLAKRLFCNNLLH